LSWMPFLLSLFHFSSSFLIHYTGEVPNTDSRMHLQIRFHTFWIMAWWSELLNCVCNYG
jgi:hypothetical protein